MSLTFPKIVLDITIFSSFFTIKRSGSNRRISRAEESNNKRKPWLRTRHSAATRRKDVEAQLDVAHDATFFVPILSAPVPVARKRAPKAQQTSSNLKNKPVQRKQKSSRQIFHPEMFGSENREALTIVPAPDLTRERGRKGRAYFGSNSKPATLPPPAVHSNDNFFSAESEEGSSRRAVAGYQAQARPGSSAVKAVSDEDDFFFDDEDDSNDEPSWVKPIFQRNGRAIERSSFYDLDKKTRR